MGECFVKDIVAKFPEPKPPYTTVASIAVSYTHLVSQASYKVNEAAKRLSMAEKNLEKADEKIGRAHV